MPSADGARLFPHSADEFDFQLGVLRPIPSSHRSFTGAEIQYSVNIAHSNAGKEVDVERESQSKDVSAIRVHTEWSIEISND